MTPPVASAACAGWLAVESAHHPLIRFAVSLGRLDPDCLTPQPGWPALHPSFGAMLEHQGFDDSPA